MLKNSLVAFAYFLGGVCVLGGTSMIASNAWMALALALGLGWIYSTQKWGAPKGTPWLVASIYSFVLAGLIVTNETNALEIGRHGRIPIAGALWIAGMICAAQLHVRFGAKRLWPIFLIAMIIGVSGSGYAGGSLTLRILQHLGLNHDLAASLVVPVRKAIHFTFFGFVGWIATRPSTTVNLEAKLAAVTVALFFACFDETHQLGFANRTASAWDVALDLAGAIVFVGLTKSSQPRKAD